MTRVFGEIAGYPEGSGFASRRELSASGVHRPLRAGISGDPHEGADSVVLAGGYEDVEDWGEVVLCTGYGGRDPQTGAQVSDQLLTRQNRALAVSRRLGLPLRLSRGSRQASPYAPAEGYRYDGLYLVEDHFRERGRAGFWVWFFRLRKLAGPGLGTPRPLGEGGGGVQVRAPLLPTRVVRESALARELKRLYDYRCQVCGVRLEGNAGPYAEAAYLRPLEPPHLGPDRFGNLLILCPNHHVLFDFGALAVADDLSLLGAAGKLRLDPRHPLEPRLLRYHRERYGFDAGITGSGDEGAR